MTQRIRYAEAAPEGFAALTAFGHYINTATTLDPILKGLIDLRVSELNGCDFCTELHKHELRKHNEPSTRIDAVARWRTSEAFTPREKAALAWAETLTQLQTGSHASDEDYNAIREFFDGKDLVDLTYSIASINAWNRLGIAFRPEWKPRAKQQNALGDDGNKVSENPA